MTLDKGRETWAAGDIAVFFRSHLEGDGINQAPGFVAFVRRYFAGRLPFKKCFEWCAGPGFIGFSLLDAGLCEQLVLSDINAEAIDCAMQTVTTNRLESRVTCYVGDNLDALPHGVAFDLVVGNPPNYFSMNPDHSLYERYKNDLRPHDRKWDLHRRFYNEIPKFLTSDACLLIEEVQPFDSIVFLGATDPLVPYDVRLEPPIDRFREMLDANGLRLRDVSWFHSDPIEGTRLSLLVIERVCDLKTQ